MRAEARWRACASRQPGRPPFRPSAALAFLQTLVRRAVRRDCCQALDAAFHWLYRAYDEHDSFCQSIPSVNLRGDPRSGVDEEARSPAAIEFVRPVGTLQAGDRIGSYVIVGPLGAGGMGEVHRAHDTKLGRDVALKVLPRALAGDPDRLARLEREARLLASLNHPNIAHVYGLEESDGVRALVMELVEGQTLADHIARGPMPLAEALPIARQICDALEAAHEHGVVHRDLKPSNIKVRPDGTVKVLDFGLAKAVDAVADPAIDSPTLSAHATEQGLILGTAAYMSPEQASGKPIDRRTDLWSFGVVLMEMLTGQRVFGGKTAAHVIAAVLTQEPEWNRLPSTMPVEIARLLHRCLEKDPRRRLDSASVGRMEIDELLSEGTSERRTDAGAASASGSRRWAVVAGVVLLALLGAGAIWWRVFTPRSASTLGRPRLVVLPFENLGNPQDAYFAEGVTDEINSRLMSLPDIAVISRASAFAYDKHGKSMHQIAADLGVDYVLEGTIQWDRATQGGRLRVTPELIKASDDTRIWTDRYDRVLADVFTIQSDVADNVVRAMGVTLATKERMPRQGDTTTDMEAHDLYLRGLHAVRLGQTAKGNLQTGLALFEAAVERDGRFIPAIEQLAETHLAMYFYFDRFSIPPDRSHVDVARTLVDKLSAAAGESADSHIARGYYDYWGLDTLAPALDEFRKALVLRPNSVPAMSGELYVLRRQGKWSEAGDLAPILLELDPQDAEVLHQCARTLMVLREYQTADALWIRSMIANPRNGTAWWYWALERILAGDLDGLDDILRRAHAVQGLDDDAGLVDHATLYARLLRRDPAGALQTLAGTHRTAFEHQYMFVPIEQLRGEACRLKGPQVECGKHFKAVVQQLLPLTQQVPNDSRYHSALGIAYAGLGERAEALREAQAGLDLMPASRDVWRRSWRRADLAYVYTLLGDRANAMAQLEMLLSEPSDWSSALIKLDPRWDSLRSDPAFQALLTAHPVPVR